MRLQSRARHPFLEALETRQLLTVSLDPISSAYGNPIAVPAGKAIAIPLTSTADSAVTYSISAPAGWSANVRGSNYPVVDFHVRYGSTGTEGDIVVQLFPDIAPNTVQIIKNFIAAGKYNNCPWHRIVPNFAGANTYIVQGGDFGDGVNANTIGDGLDNTGLNFADEFAPNAIFDGNGQLAMANSGKDTNGSQFFLTYQENNPTAMRGLDFNYTIFGQVVRGFDVLAALAKVPVYNVDHPVSPATIVSATLISDTRDATLLLTAPASASSGTVTVTARDAQGNTSSRDIAVSAAADVYNDPPILGPVGNYAARPNQAINIALTGTDIDSGSLEYQVFAAPSPAAAPPAGTTASVSGNVITVNPPANYTGTFLVQVSVRQAGAASRGASSNPWDSQVISLTWTSSVTAPTGKATASPVYGNAGGTTNFSVQFTSNNVLDVSTLKVNNAVMVTGPNGFAAFAKFLSIDSSLNASNRTGTYQVSAPGGFWDAADAGTYAVWIAPGVVKDMVGNTASAKIIGSFTYSPTVLFNEAYYLANNKDVASVVNSGGLPSGYSHFIQYGQFEGRQPSLYYSESFYLSQNGDVATAVANHVIASGFVHYLNYGLAEGRQGSPFWDEYQYKLLNGDVAAAVTQGAFSSGLDHFVRYGQYEGRRPNLLFDPSYYTSHNPDLATALSNGVISSLYDHFLQYGQFEGRLASPWYSESYYLGRYADVANAVTSKALPNGLLHFMSWGFREKRAGSANFDAAWYLNKYPDVAAAINAGAFRSALEHYVLYGMNEGRLGHA